MPVRRDETKQRWVYQKVVKLPDGRKIRISGSSSLNTRQETEREERDHIRRVIEGREPQEQKEMPTLTEFVEGPDGWLLKYPLSEGNRPSSIRAKEGHWRFHIKPVLGDYPLDMINKEVLAGFIAGIRKSQRRGRNKQDGRPISSKTVKNIRTTLRKILVTAVEWERIDKVPPIPKVKVPDPAWDFYTREEASLLVASTMDPERRALLLFPIRMGARAGEQLAVEWPDIDWVNGFITIERSSVRGVVGPPKNGKTRRVPMSGELATALKAIRHLRSKLVFCNDDGTPLTLDQLHERLWSAQRKAGLRKIRWHDLRHTFGSQLSAAGVPPRQIQEWMGHSTITQTMRYMHLAPGGGRELISVLDGTRAEASGKR